MRNVTVILLAACALYVGGCDRLQDWMHPDRCCLDGRPCHPGMAVGVEAEGVQTGKACCLRCAVTYAEKNAVRVRILWVTDYVRHEQIVPGGAAFVTGSRVTPCAGSPVEASVSRLEVSMQSWDRCLPSIIAFSTREEARAFQERSGGSVLTFDELVGGTHVSAANE